MKEYNYMHTYMCIKRTYTCALISYNYTVAMLMQACSFG